jgi:inhibitor of KinA sporulation pathway (predicted exonuclease)
VAKALDKIIVVDVEATCWDNPDGKPPDGQVSDIIEIGICLLDLETLERLGKHSIIVKPSRSTVSPFCTQLTTLTQEVVDKGVSFEMACREMTQRYPLAGRAWASWGDYDRKHFARNCKDLGVPFPFGPTHQNVKNLFAIMAGLSREVSVSDAVRRLGMKFEGTLHRGVDDAWAVAAILADVLKRGRTHDRK